MRKIGRWCLSVCFFLLTLALIRAAGPINAYLADADQAENQLVIGGNRISIRETFETPEELIPGQSYTKTVQVDNCGQSECYVRIKAVFTDSEVGKYCTLDWNLEDFVHRDDGFYYYKNALSHGEKTTYLFTTVSVGGDLPVGSSEECSILVYAESCQAEGFDDYETAWRYWGRNQS